MLMLFTAVYIFQYVYKLYAVDHYYAFQVYHVRKQIYAMKLLTCILVALATVGKLNILIFNCVAFS